MCTFLLQKVHCGISVWSIVGFLDGSIETQRTIDRKKNVHGICMGHANTMYIILAIYLSDVVVYCILLMECNIEVVASKCLGTIKTFIPEQNVRYLADILKAYSWQKTFIF